MGMVLGLIGGGGSILTVPIFVYLFGFSGVEATHYSLFVVGFVALSSLFLGSKTHPLESSALFRFGAPSMLSVVLIRKFVLPVIPEVVFQSQHWVLLKEDLILSLFGILMVLASLSMLKDTPRAAAKSVTGVRASLLVVLQGVFVGAVTGFVGAGGGFLITPALVRFQGLGLKSAVGTSLAIVAINSLVGFFVSPEVVPLTAWNVLVFSLLVAVLGMIFAKKYSSKISDHSLRKIFASLVFVIGMFVIISQKI